MSLDLSSFLSDILNLAYPISVSEVLKDEGAKRLDVYLSVSQDYLPSSAYIRPGYYRGRQWRHLDCMEYRFDLHGDLPIFRPQESGKTFPLDLRLSRQGGNITLKLDKRGMDFMRIHPCLSEVAVCESVLVDEVSQKRGHPYRTSLVDSQGAFLWIEEGRASDTLEEFYQVHPYPEAIYDISMGMSPAFIKGTKLFFNILNQ